MFFISGISPSNGEIENITINNGNNDKRSLTSEFIYSIAVAFTAAVIKDGVDIIAWYIKENY